jgi:hypothetical protein
LAMSKRYTTVCRLYVAQIPSYSAMRYKARAPYRLSRVKKTDSLHLMGGPPKTTIRRRLAQAGVRLARLLDEAPAN